MPFEIRPHGLLRRGLLCTALLAVTSLAHAQTGIVKVVVPFPAGGVTDQAARILIEKMGPQLGQTLIIENRPGAGSRLGIDQVMKSPADGMTLLFTNTSFSIMPVVDPKAGFDPAKAFEPVALCATYSLQMVTSTRVPANTLPEFVAYAKKNPGKLSYGSAGVGSGTHFAGEFFKALTGTYLVHIPYKSTSGALNDVAGGQLELAIDGAAKPLIDGGRVKLLAVTGDKRDPRFPNTPTAVESGLKGYVQQSWVGFLAPAGTPPAVIDKLNKAAQAAAGDAGVQKRFAEMGLSPQQAPAGRLGEEIKGELVLYRRIANDARLKFD